MILDHLFSTTKYSSYKLIIHDSTLHTITYSVTIATSLYGDLVKITIKMKDITVHPWLFESQLSESQLSKRKFQKPH